MSSCTFFGHTDTPKEIEPILRSTLIELIEKQNVHLFFVGNHGCFDQMVTNTLNTLKNQYPEIQFYIVLAYLPTEKQIETNKTDTVFPEGIECVPKRFAIVWRNQWMIDRSDFVITFVQRNFGGAATFQKKAAKKGKRIINLAERCK